MSDTNTDDVGFVTEPKKTEEIVLGFCSKFQPQYVPRAVGPNKKLINYEPYYFPCIGDNCMDSWCHVHGMCRHACEHLEEFHLEEEGNEEEINLEAIRTIVKI